jgi:predicted lipid-binding transport protein (Tim44 family)
VVQIKILQITLQKTVTAARALLGMKQAEPSFSVTEFLYGSKSAYEMILMAFENGDFGQCQSIPK